MEKAIRNIRRAIVRAEFDVEEALKAKDVNKRGTVPFNVWSKILKQYDVEIKPIEMEAIFKFYSVVTSSNQGDEEEMDYQYLFIYQIHFV